MKIFMAIALLLAIVLVTIALILSSHNVAQELSSQSILSGKVSSEDVSSKDEVPSEQNDVETYVKYNGNFKNDFYKDKYARVFYTDDEGKLSEKWVNMLEEIQGSQNEPLDAVNKENLIKQGMDEKVVAEFKTRKDYDEYSYNLDLYDYQILCLKLKGFKEDTIKEWKQLDFINYLAYSNSKNEKFGYDNPNFSDEVFDKILHSGLNENQIHCLSNMFSYTEISDMTYEKAVDLLK